MNPLLANLVFEPYLSLFTAVTAIGAALGLVVGLVIALRKDSVWLKALFVATALSLAFMLAPLPGRGPSSAIQLPPQRSCKPE